MTIAQNSMRILSLKDIKQFYKNLKYGSKMPKKYPVEIVQPSGSHNPPCECVVSDSVKDYISLGFPHLNPVQSAFIPYLEDDDTNIVVAAPTSSGKTLCAEFFIARALKQGKKALYIAPMKALTDEKYYEWTEVSHHFSVYKIEILTGDFILSDAKRKSLNEANIIFLTPEMFNSKCRYYNDHEWLWNSVIIGDEIHLTGANLRGDKLEVGLIQYFEKAPQTRTLFLSATIPNVQDFADWLEHNTKRKSIVINSAYRPCKLENHYIPFTVKQGSGYEEKEMARMDEVIKLACKLKEEPIIIFVGNKTFGRRISERLTALHIKNEFHNADKDREARNKIESSFRNGDFNILVASSTVAWGCNSPARHVLLSHTSYGLTKMEPQDVHQAIGRAGRLGYSDKGDAHIFFSANDLHAEKQRIFGAYEVRSTLNDVNVMMFHILSYIDNGNIKTAQQLYDWHDRTLASIQKRRLGVEIFTLKIAQSVLDNLEIRKMIKKDEKEEYSTTEMGQITARMYMSPLDVSDWFRNFSKIKQLNPKKGQDQKIKEAVNIATSMAFSNCYSWAKAANCYISKAEQRAKVVWDLVNVLQRHNLLTSSNIKDMPYLKYAAIFYALLNGNTKIDPQLQSIYSSLRQDFSRMISTMRQIDMRYGSYHKKSSAECLGYGWGEEWDYLMFRLVYPGISPSLWNLVSVDGIGQVYAERLFNAGIKDKAHIMAEVNKEKIEDILGKKRAQNVLESLGVHCSEIPTGTKIKKPKTKSEKKPKTNISKKNKELIVTKDLF